MIKQTDLRIGNAVKLSEEGELYFIRALNAIDTMLFQPTEVGVFSKIVHYEELIPIPLTPEILESCGFEFHSIFEQYQIQRDLYLIVGDRFGHIEKWKVLHNPFNEEWKYSVGDHRHVAIKYLHQLQNLYHALTGTELSVNIKEKV